MFDCAYLEKPSSRRGAEFLRLAEASRRLHRGWVSPPVTESAYSEYLRNCRKKSFRGFFVCVADTKELAGVANISNIVGGPFQSAFLGFYAFQASARQGYMTAGLGLVLDVAFGELGLHRLEANIQPANVPSKRLVQKLGFQLEGYSPRYLKIGGRWRDHERWAILAEVWGRRGNRSGASPAGAFEGRGANEGRTR